MFPTTLWTTVLDAGREDTRVRRDCLERLIRRYWKPAFHYLRALDRTRARDEAEDLIQEFFTRLLEKEALAEITPERGSFRGFLKQALRNFAIDAHRRKVARRPRDGMAILQIDELRDAEPSADGDPESVFDREWDNTVFRAAIEELERRLSAAGMQREWQAFRDYCLPASGKPGTYRDIARKHGLTESQVRKGLHRCRNELRAILAERVREYAQDDGEVEVELKRITGS